MITLTEALAKADPEVDAIERRILLDAEAMVRDMGGTDDEIAARLG